MNAGGDAALALRQENEQLRARIAELECQQGTAGERSSSAEAAHLDYHSLLEAEADGIFLIDATGFVDCNESGARMYGLTRKEVIGRSPADSSPERQPDGRLSVDAAAAAVAAASAGQTQHFEWVSRRAGGALIDVEVTLSRIRGAEGLRLLAIVRDVTDRKRMELALRESEALLSETQELAHAGGWNLDLVANRLSWTDEAYRIFGLRPQEFGATNENFLEAVHPEDRAAVDEAYARSLREDRDGYEIEHRVVRRDTGEIRHVAERCRHQRNAEGRIIRSLGTVQDITLRKRMERQQRLRAEVLQVLIESSGPAESISRVLNALQRETGADALGMRLAEGEDFPYFAQAGFSPDFLLAENALTVRGEDGYPCRDQDGNVTLECTCGLVLSGKADPENPLFTVGGSCWTNDAPASLHLPAEQDPRLHPRNRCIHAGFNSVALVPIRANAEILGLLQLNYRRKDALTLDEVRGFEELCSMIGLALRRQQAEEALRETEQKFAAAFRFSPAVITLTDVAGGFRYVDVNDAFERVVGYSRAEAIGRTPADLGIWADPRDFAEATSRLRQDGRLRDFEFHFRRKDGEIRTGIISAVPVEIKGSQYSIGSTIDITDRKQAEEALRQSQALLGAVIDGTTDAVFAKDDQGRYVMFNRAAERFTGQPAAGVLGNDDRSLFPPAEAAMVMAGDRRVIEGGTPVTYEEIVTTADGRQTTFLSTKGPLLDAGGQPYGLFGISRDITERKRLEEQLLTILKAVESTSDAVGISDAEGRHYYQNASASKLFGYVTAEEMAAAGGGAAVVKDPEVAREMFARIMSGASWTGELEMVTKDGRVFPAYERADAIRDAEGKIIGLVGIVTDITGRKRAEAEREHLQLQLAQAQKMESIGRLAGGVAHDFNNLLTVINGYSQLALARLSAGDPLRGSLTEINRAGERAAGLTRQLLAFSRKQVLQPRVLDLNRVVGEMRAMLERLMGEDVEVHFALGPESPLVRADPHQLEQTVMNLAVNARDAMPRGGRLLVETALVDLDESYAAAHADARAGRYALLAVSDTGAGMDEATRQRIFEPFFTTKGPGQGAGLGLSTVQGIVVQSGGFINVYSEPGQGTTLKIYLPALAGVAAEAGKPEAVPAPRGSETILLVEDQEEVRDFAATVLKAYGYRVIPASNAGEAILICERESTHFHMVLTDVVMPHTSGRELASRLEKLRPGIKTLFMSGYTDNVIGRHGVLDEGAELIQKPFSPAELARKVRTVLGPPGSNAPDPLKQSQADPAS